MECSRDERERELPSYRGNATARPTASKQLRLAASPGSSLAHLYVTLASCFVYSHCSYI